MSKQIPEVDTQETLDFFEEFKSIHHIERDIEASLEEEYHGDFDEYPSDQELDFNDPPRPSQLDLYTEED